MTITANIHFGAWEGTAYFHEHYWWTAPRPIAEFLGIRWQPQAAKIQASEVLSTVTIKVTAADGKKRDMLALRTDDIGLWLIQISPSKVAEPARPALVEMQRSLRAAIETQINEAFGIPAPADLDDLMRAPVPAGLECLAPAIYEQRAMLLAEPGVARAALMFKLGLPGTKTGALLGRSAYWANKKRRMLTELFVLEPRKLAAAVGTMAPANDGAEEQLDMFGGSASGKEAGQ